jgi:hypothetical protein
MSRAEEAKDVIGRTRYIGRAHAATANLHKQSATVRVIAGGLFAARLKTSRDKREFPRRARVDSSRGAKRPRETCRL